MAGAEVVAAAVAGVGVAALAGCCFSVDDGQAHEGVRAALPSPLVVVQLPDQVTDARFRTEEGKVDESAFCNDAAALAADGTASKIVWHVRHGQSMANLAKEAAKQADAASGKPKYCREPGSAYRHYCDDVSLLDAPLSPAGVRQAEASARKVAAWAVTPTLVVASPMTRALQTAAIVFRRQLEEGSAQLIIRPELREFYPHCQENRGRPFSELLACPRLQAAPLQAALRAAAQEGWAADWDGSWAQGEGFAEHCESSRRLEEWRHWLAGREECRIASVCHYGSINTLLNREPWADAHGRSMALQWNGAKGLPPAAGGPALELRSVAQSLLASGLHSPTLPTMILRTGCPTPAGSRSHCTGSDAADA